MKRKLLFTSLLLIIVTVIGVVTLTSCATTKYNIEFITPDADDQWIQLDPSGNHVLGMIEEGTSQSYSFQIRDDMDVDTLKFYVNDVETEYTLDSNYTKPLTISGQWLPLFTYTIDSVSENVKMSFTCDATKISFTFSLAANPTSLTVDQKNILNHLSLKQETSLLGTYDNPITITKTYKELAANNWALPLTYSAANGLGCVIINNGFMGQFNVFPDPTLDYLASYNVYVINDATVSVINEIGIDPTKAELNTFFIETTQNPLISLTGTNPYDPGSGYTISAGKTYFDVHFATVDGVDYTNATLKINNTVVVGGDSGVSFADVISDGYFRIFCSDAPAYYMAYEEGDIISEDNRYVISIDGVDFDDDKFVKVRIYPDNYVLFARPANVTPYYVLEENIDGYTYHYEYYLASELIDGTLEITRPVYPGDRFTLAGSVKILLPNGTTSTYQVYGHDASITNTHLCDVATVEQEASNVGDNGVFGYYDSQTGIKYVIERKCTQISPSTEYYDNAESVTVSIPTGGLYTIVYNIY